MTNYNQRSKFGGQKNKQSGGRDNGGNSGRNSEMFQAICVDCKKSCEVPFKPNGMKPVYCNDCFGKNGGQVSTNHFSSKSFATAPRPSDDSKKLDQQTQLLVALNTKFDKMIALIENLNQKDK